MRQMCLDDLGTPFRCGILEISHTVATIMMFYTIVMNRHDDGARRATGCGTDGTAHKREPNVKPDYSS